jgi:UDP:flavonoid glycosyltransferase YjiC (YdhE family)
VPANAHVEQVAPHSAVLNKGRLLVTHAGHGSVMKALRQGRPMVLRALGRDQARVAARAEALGVAEVVARGGRENAEDALAAALDRTLAFGDADRGRNTRRPTPSD